METVKADEVAASSMIALSSKDALPCLGLSDRGGTRDLKGMTQI